MMDYPKKWISGPLCEFIQPQKEKVAPSNFPDMPFIGMDHVEAHTTKIIGSVKAKHMKSNAVRFSDNDVLYGRLRPYLNKVAQPQFNGLASAEFIVFRGNELIDPGFLRFRLSALDFVSFASHLNEGDRPRVSFDQIGNFNVWLPPPKEQRRIVEKVEALFDEIDKGVESLHAAKSTLDLYRKSLLKSAFEGRLTADWRAKNPDKLEDPEALLPRIRKEREQHHQSTLEEWKKAVSDWREQGEHGKKPIKPRPPAQPGPCNPSSQQEVPNGWFYLPFEALAWSIRNGISVKPDEIGPLKIFRISAVRPMAFDLNDSRRITDPNGRMEDYRLTYGDLVFTRYNGSRDYVGVSAMYRGDGTHVYPDKLIRCQIKSDFINPAYLEAATNSGKSRAHIVKRIRTTAGQSGISGSDIKTMPVPVCSPAEQAEIARILDERLQAANRLESEIEAALAHAEALRQSILKNAFSGRLVPQDPNDEPAATLLQRILAKKASHNPDRAKRRVSTA